MDTPLFELKNVCVDYFTNKGSVRAVHKVNLSGKPGETLGIVGESGSGKSSLGRALLLLEPLSFGKVHFEGVDVTEKTGSQMRKLRRNMQLIFQDPDASLNQRRTAGWHLNEVFSTHFPTMSSQEREDHLLRVLNQVQFDPSLRIRYPFELSGGQKQRLAIARAVLLSPKLMVLDEPLSSLDATLRKSILCLLRELQREYNMGYVFITHDLSTLSAVATNVAVMYRGSIVEFSTVADLYQKPTHPYTMALLSCIPIPDPYRERLRKSIFFPPKGSASPVGVGCPFAHRCPLAKPICYTLEPTLTEVSSSHQVACHRPHDTAELKARF
jgi:oligopeptide transport system ATP-binding protein